MGHALTDGLLRFLAHPQQKWSPPSVEDSAVVGEHGFATPRLLRRRSINGPLTLACSR